MIKRKYSATQKGKHVIASSTPGVVVTHYCREQKVSRSSIYRWRKRFFERF